MAGRRVPYTSIDRQGRQVGRQARDFSFSRFGRRWREAPDEGLKLESTSTLALF